MSDPLMPTVEVERKEDGHAEVHVAESSQEVIATPLTGFLQVSNPTTEEQSQLKAIWDYVVDQTDSELMSERLMAVRHIEQRLATPRLGQTRISQLYQYIVTDKQARTAEELRDSLLR